MIFKTAGVFFAVLASFKIYVYGILVFSKEKIMGVGIL